MVNQRIRQPSGRQSKRTTDLAERAKELGCLISVSRVLADRHSPIASVLERVVDEIPSGWRYPELASVRLTWNDQQWTAPGFCVTPWMMVQAIGAGPEPIGSIEVAYTERPLPESSSPFLPEESRLLKAIAERVADVIELNKAEDALGAYRDQLRSLASQLATTEERQRRDIATYLHDRIGQELALVKLRLESVRGCARDDEQNRVIDQVCELAAEVIRKTRTLTFEISPPILHELGLGPAIDWLADTIRSQHGLPVEVIAEPVPELGDDLTALVFRSTNELLINVVRHAGARSAVVRVRASGSWLRIEVQDDGCGFLPGRVVEAGASGAFGLFSIRERLAHIGGRLELVSTPGEGTHATIVAPVARKGTS
ncbi:MAG: sensor histidine kinase [Kofleriaceae bacterium]|nr:sensor histidine kinase [Kofleriaceae bacterium]